MSGLCVIFEDENLLVIDKPAHWIMARREGLAAARPALVEQVQALHGRAVMPAHRIDDEVGGLVAFAKSRAGHDFLSGQFQGKTARRIYHALAVVAEEGEADAITRLPLLRKAGGGLPADFEVNYALGPDHDAPERMHVYRRKGGRPAFTRFRVLESFGRFVWLEGQPQTSHPLQVQAHLAAVGVPVLGDQAHGLPAVRLLLSDLKRGYKGRDQEKPLLSGLALHATRLAIRHPGSREPVEFASPLPNAFQIALKNLRKFSGR